MDEPLSAGADQVTVAEVRPATATGRAGASGTADSLSADEVEAELVPTPLEAFTEKTYSSPRTRPPRSAEDA